MPPYQLFEPLAPAAYEALKRDIQHHGIRVPVELDEHGNILDGHNRVKIARELGITYREERRTFENEAEKLEYAIKLNLLRRQLGPLQWARAFEQLREARGIAPIVRHNRRTPRAATVAALAEEVGVNARTARDRVQLFQDLQAYPEVMQRVDAGAMTAKAARRAIRQRPASAAEGQQQDTPQGKTNETPLSPTQGEGEVSATEGSVPLRVLSGERVAALQDQRGGPVGQGDAALTKRFSHDGESPPASPSRGAAQEIPPTTPWAQEHTSAQMPVDLRAVGAAITAMLRHAYPAIPFQVTAADDQIIVKRVSHESETSGTATPRPAADDPLPHTTEEDSIAKSHDAVIS